MSASDEIKLQELKTSHKVDLSEHEHLNDDKARFAKLRDDLAGWQWLCFSAIVFLGAAISGYDVSNVATIQVSIYKAYGHIDLLPWIVTAFSLGNAATSPLLDRIMKVMDLKWFMLACWVLFLVASAVAGASPTIEGVIVGRIILGISGGGIYLALLTYINILSRPVEHAKLNGLLGMGFAVGLILGPVIGGAFADNEHATWRWAFYICLPYGAAVMTLILLACPSVQVRPQAALKSLYSIDWVGAVLHIVTLVLFDAACIFSGSTLAWDSGVIALWVLAGVAAITYLLQQHFSWFTSPAERFLPVSVLSTRTGLLVVLSTFMAVSGYAIGLYYLPLFYAFSRGDGPLETAAHMLSFIATYIVGAIASGILLPKIRRYAGMYLFGGVLIVAGSAAMQSVTNTAPIGQAMGISAIIGLGVGFTSQLGASVLNFGLPADIRMDSAITMTVTIYSGITIALAVAGCIYQNIGFSYLSNALSGSPLSEDQIREAFAGVASSAWESELSPDIVASALGAIATAVIRIFYISVAGGALMVILALLMKWKALDFRLKSDEPAEASELA